MAVLADCAPLVAQVIDMRELQIHPISRTAFAPYGDLIEANATIPDAINAGTVQRFTDLTRIYLTEAGTQACVHVYRSTAQGGDIQVRDLECHPFGSQLFMPLQGQRFIAVVAPSGEAPRPANVRAFLIGGGRGINLYPGVWHHPLLSLTEGDYLVIERTDPSRNLEQAALSEHIRLVAGH